MVLGNIKSLREAAFEEPIVDALCIFYALYLFCGFVISMKKNELCYRSAHYRWYVVLIGYDETNTTMILCFRYEVDMTQMQDATGVF